MQTQGSDIVEARYEGNDNVSFPRSGGCLRCGRSIPMAVLRSSCRGRDGDGSDQVGRWQGCRHITFTEATAGVLIKLELKGLPPGKHAIHVHETGKCEGDFSSAGAIYNPLGAKHGFLHDEGPMAGDLPNLYAGADGSVVAEVLSPFLTLSKEAEETLFDTDKTSVVIFAKGDDYESEPDGGAGARVACGVIVTK